MYKHTTLFHKIFFSRGMALFILALVIFVAFSVAQIAGKSREAARARKISEDEATSLREKQSELAAKLAALKTPEGQEAAIREQYPVVKEGEHVVVITDETPQKTSIEEKTPTNNKNNGFLEFLKNLFQK